MSVALGARTRRDPPALHDLPASDDIFTGTVTLVVERLTPELLIAPLPLMVLAKRVRCFAKVSNVTIVILSNNKINQIVYNSAFGKRRCSPRQPADMNGFAQNATGPKIRLQTFSNQQESPRSDLPTRSASPKAESTKSSRQTSDHSGYHTATNQSVQ